MVKEYLKAVNKEQSVAHIVPKQAKPFFLGKLRTICYFIDRKLQSTNLEIDKKFLYLRYQTFFKNSFFFVGDRVNDTGQCIM